MIREIPLTGWRRHLDWFLSPRWWLDCELCPETVEDWSRGYRPPPTWAVFSKNRYSRHPHWCFCDEHTTQEIQERLIKLGYGSTDQR